MNEKVDIKLKKKQVEEKLLLYRQLLIMTQKQCNEIVKNLEAKIAEIEDK